MFPSRVSISLLAPWLFGGCSYVDVLPQEVGGQGGQGGETVTVMTGYGGEAEIPTSDQPPPRCQVVWDEVVDLPLDPIYQVNGSLVALVPNPDFVSLVSLTNIPLQYNEEVTTTRIWSAFSGTPVADPPVLRGLEVDGNNTRTHGAPVGDGNYEIASIADWGLIRPDDQPVEAQSFAEPPQFSDVGWDREGRHYVVRLVEGTAVVELPTGEQAELSASAGFTCFARITPRVGQGVLLSLWSGNVACDDFDTQETWFVGEASAGGGALLQRVPLESFKLFGEGPNGTLGVNEAGHIVAISDTGQPGEIVKADPLGTNWTSSYLQIVPWLDGFAIVTTDYSPDLVPGLRIFAFPGMGSVTVSEPLAANALQHPNVFAALSDEATGTLLVAYEDNATGGRLARAVCQ